MTAVALIEEARADGLELWPAGERLKLRGTAAAIERWKPRLAEHKQEVMAALAIDDDLERLIQTTAEFYAYSDDDLRLAREAAHRDPEGLRRALLADPLLPYMRGRTIDDVIGGANHE